VKLSIAFFGARRKVIPVASLEEASACFAAHRDSEGFGASDMLLGCGDVREGGLLVGRISYNGRIWSPDGKPLDGLTGQQYLKGE
jgi:hypothetical protein